MIVEKELRGIELQVHLLISEIIIILQLIQALDEHQRVIWNLIVILHIDLTDGVVNVPKGSIDDQCLVVLVGKGQSRYFVIQVKHTDTNGHARGLMRTIGCDHVERVLISVFAIERIEKIEFPIGGRETKERDDLVGWMIEGIGQRRMIGIVRCHLTEIAVRSIVFIDGELVRRLRKLERERKREITLPADQD